MPSNEEAQKLSIDLATPILLCPLCLWQNRVTQTGLKLSDYVIVLLLLLLYLYLFGMILHGWDAVLIWLCSAFVSTRMVYRLPLSLCVLSSSFRIYCFALIERPCAMCMMQWFCLHSPTIWKTSSQNALKCSFIW